MKYIILYDHSKFERHFILLLSCRAPRKLLSDVLEGWRKPFQVGIDATRVVDKKKKNKVDVV